MRNQRILVISHANSFSEEFKAKLPDADSGWMLDFATHMEEALRKLASADMEKAPYALIFLDSQMFPKSSDTISAIAKIWEDVPFSDIVLCTGNFDDSVVRIVSHFDGAERLFLLKRPFDTIEVKQLTIALTKKWNSEHCAKMRAEELEQKFQERTKEFDEERARSVHGAKLMELGEMAGGVAHEINNPLAIIHANAANLMDLIEEGFDKTLALKLVQDISSTAERIAKVVRGLKSFSRDGDNDPFEPAAVEQIVEDALGICREKYKLRNIQVFTDVKPSDIEIECRHVQITQVLLNLLNNVYDAIEGFPERWVRIDVRSNKDDVEISVTDCGHGIPAHLKDKIYEPFFTTKVIGKGTGLGLSISRKLVESHGGRLWNDETCKNTRFVITLPRHPAVVSCKGKVAYG